MHLNIKFFGQRKPDLLHFNTRPDAQEAVDDMYLQGEITLEEWSRQTDILSERPFSTEGTENHEQPIRIEFGNEEDSLVPA